MFLLLRSYFFPQVLYTSLVISFYPHLVLLGSKRWWGTWSVPCCTSWSGTCCLSSSRGTGLAALAWSCRPACSGVGLCSRSFWCSANHSRRSLERNRGRKRWNIFLCSDQTPDKIIGYIVMNVLGQLQTLDLTNQFEFISLVINNLIYFLHSLSLSSLDENEQMIKSRSFFTSVGQNQPCSWADLVVLHRYLSCHHSHGVRIMQGD